jgi:hypothetical protein
MNGKVTMESKGRALRLITFWQTQTADYRQGHKGKCKDLKA